MFDRDAVVVSLAGSFDVVPVRPAAHRLTRFLIIRESKRRESIEEWT
jgi:hypothetical protein